MEHPQPKHHKMRELKPAAKRVSEQPSHSTAQVPNSQPYVMNKNRENVPRMPNGVIATVENVSKNSRSIVDNPRTQLDDTVQVHRPPSEVFLPKTPTRSPSPDGEDSMTNSESYFFDSKQRVKRKGSFTHSEKEAVGTLDAVLGVFDDVDDNLTESSVSESNKIIEATPYLGTSEFDPSYETMADIKESLVSKDVKNVSGVHDGSSNSNESQGSLTTSMMSPQKKDENKVEVGSSNSSYSNNSLMVSTSVPKKFDNEDNLIPPPDSEPLYAKPVKPAKNGASLSINPGQLIAPRLSAKTKEEKPPVVPPRKFSVEEENHEIKFTPPKEISPSASLSKSLNKTAWANAKEIPSPKRKLLQSSHDNFSLKRGQLSGPVPINPADDYVEPPRDYDTNPSLKSFAGSSTDESVSRDMRESMSSSSTTGSDKTKKEFRAEVNEIIEKRKAVKEQGKDVNGRHYDGLVNSSFRMMKQVSLTSMSSQREETQKVENDYAAITNAADRWLQNYERIRANSGGKKDLPLKSKPGKSPSVGNVYHNEESSATKLEKGLSSDLQLPLSETTHAVLNKRQSSKATSHLRANRQDDLSDDENLVQLMESGISAENSTEAPPPSPKLDRYVPRAMRMSIGQSWDGIRKDRREWKSREMKQAVGGLSAHKVGKNLSNRFDDEKVQLEMLF